MSCRFCDELEAKTPNILSVSGDEQWAARWDMYPLVPGHVEIIPTQHVAQMNQLGPQQLSTMMVFAQEVQATLQRINLRYHYERHIRQYISTEMSRRMINKVLGLCPKGDWLAESWLIAMADGNLAGQTVPHLHLHLIPLTSKWIKELDLDLRCHVRRLFNDPYTKRIIES